MSHTYEICLALGVVIPLISFAFLAFYGARIGKPKASYVALAAIGASCLLSAYVLMGWLGMGPAARAAAEAGAFRYHWGVMGSIPINVGVKLDSLTVIMYFMVTFIAFWIHFFSIGYMEGHSDEVDGQSKYHRFFTYLSLFCFSMLGLVISSSLLFLFIFWELVGLCSYLLIGFYFERKYASNAAMKAFITNRVGDFGFIIGLAMVVLYMGTFDLDAAAANFAADYRASAAHEFAPAESAGIFKGLNLSQTMGWEVDTAKGEKPIMISGMLLATIMGIGLFCGAMGKSAQFPLHVWLPDAMAGPTPVSALIHAATMVAAGVYLVARVFRLLTPDAQFFIAVIGCITLTITALIAIVQTDIKKILAYSTLSQLGYMIFGLGVGAWVAALFHLMTHAFFKAMLFLGSGQVIEGCHHEQEITKMGGLRKKMPVTCWTFFIGVLAIAGFGIPAAHIGLGGYFSKDEILAVAYERAFNWHGAAAHDDHSASGGSHAAAANDECRMLNAKLTDAAPDARDAGPIRLASHTSPVAPAFNILHSAFSASDAAHHGPAGPTDKLGIAANIPALPRIMFWLPIIIAYITPFYMMRCWYLTFCGEPRDHHVYDHAHENWKMYVPLAVLAVGTVICSYFIFRPLIAEAGGAATDAAAVVAIDGEAHGLNDLPGRIVGEGDAAKASPTMISLTHGDERWTNPHMALVPIVGLSWAIGMGFAWLIYRNGLGLATAIKGIFPLNVIHMALSRKLFFDDIYDNVLVAGTRAVGYICGKFDAVIIDGLVNLTAFFTKSVGVFAGRQLDMPVREGDAGLVDGMANLLANSVYAAGGAIRRPQNGRIRTYVMLTAGAVGVVLLFVLFFDEISGGYARLTRSFFAAAE